MGKNNKTLHIFCIYGYDVGQKDTLGQSNHERGNRSIRDRLSKFITQLGRVPWVIGGDWNAQPGTFVIEGTKNTAAYIDPGKTKPYRKHIRLVHGQSRTVNKCRN